MGMIITWVYLGIVAVVIALLAGACLMAYDSFLRRRN